MKEIYLLMSIQDKLLSLPYHQSRMKRIEDITLQIASLIQNLTK